MVAYPRQPLAQYASELKDEIVVVTKGRRAVAALVPLKNVDRESLALRPPPSLAYRSTSRRCPILTMSTIRSVSLAA